MNQAASKLSLFSPAPIVRAASGPAVSWSTIATPLFSSPWWLDAVAPGRWSEVLIQSNGQTRARLAYAFRDYPLLGRVVSQPPLTPYLGPELYGLHREPERQIGEQNELMAALIDGLPQFSRFQQNFSPQAANWLPFFWRGFSQHTRYTYRFNDLSDLDAIWRRFESRVRGAIRKAQKQVAVDADANAAEIYRMLELTYARQALRPKYSFNLLAHLYEAACARGQGRLLAARDAQGRMHAGVFLVWDQRAAYYLVGGADPELRASGAVSLLIWEAIRLASKVTACFDFEGSMQPGIESFFRSFGAVQTPYFRVARNNFRAASAEKVVHYYRRLRQATARRRSA
jgi:hypothetical protein